MVRLTSVGWCVGRWVGLGGWVHGEAGVWGDVGVGDGVMRAGAMVPSDGLASRIVGE